jgi:glucose/arabinose dehydrogenase
MRAGSLRVGAAALLTTATLLLTGPLHAAKRGAYVTDGLCDSLPRVDLETPAGLCVGLVASGFKFTRGIAPLPNGDLLVADMGGWVKRRGSIWLLSRDGDIYAKTQLLSRLDEPHGIALGPDGLVYVGVLGRIFRFALADPDGTIEDVIGGASAIAPLPATGLHPLTNFVFDRAGDLYVTVGSATNNCEGPDDALPDAAAPCPETLSDAPRGVVRKYEMAWPGGRVLSWSNLATGLRNALALVVHPSSNRVYAADNARDSIDLVMPELPDDENLPHDEFNLLQEGKHYGWPYCYDDGVPSPEYSDADCGAYEPPLRLLAAHAAPLGMAYYDDALLDDDIGGTLLVAYHGYRRHGHRLLAFPVDADGVPASEAFELIGGWEAGPTRPQGAPVDVKIGADGAVYLSEDHNGTVLRLAPDSSSP